MLIDFCRDNELFVTSTTFRHREHRKVTWRSPDGRTSNIIDLILVCKRWSVSVNLPKNIKTRHKYKTTLSNKLSSIQLTRVPTTEKVYRLIDESASIIRATANEILGEQSCSDKLWITPRIISISAEKRIHTNKQDQIIQDEYKRLKILVEKKIRQALRQHVDNNCHECEEAFK